MVTLSSEATSQGTPRLAAKIRVHELAKELGMTNKEALDLSLSLGIGVKSHSSGMEEAQADRVRRKAEREGLIREVQPEEPAKPTKKGAAAVAVAPAAVDTPAAPVVAEVVAPVSVPVVEAPVAVAPVVEAPAAVVKPKAPKEAVAPVVEAPSVPERSVDVEAVVTAPAPAAVVEVPAVAPVETEESTVPGPRPSLSAPAGSSRIISSSNRPGSNTAGNRPATPSPAVQQRQNAASPAAQAPVVSTPLAPAGDDVAAAAAPGAPIADAAVPRGPQPAPRSATGKPIPPPPGMPRSFSGRPIPPPPGPRSTPPGRPGGPGGGRGGGARPQQRQSRSKRRKAFEELEPTRMMNYSRSDAQVPSGEIIVERGMSAQEIGPRFNRTAADVVKFLMGQGEMVTGTASLTDEMIELFALEVGGQLLLVDPGQQQEAELQQLFDDDDDPELEVTRPPIITIMGHVDHGKTLLLDRIRETNVIAGEAGGITQHIGAYQITKDGRKISFIDTPGHEAFTAMRARGAGATDIVVLVVAANDGVMPQTIEALSHAKAADVPIIVAINKIDIPDSDPNRVMQQLTEYELVPEAWGGDTIMVEVSALQRLGIDDLLEQLLLVADLEDLRANPDGPGRGVVLEANLDIGRGPVATVLVERGTLRVGDPMVAGGAWGTVRALIDDTGKQIKEAGPSMPVQVLGLSAVPGAGDEFRVAKQLKTAKTVAEAREQRFRSIGLRGSSSAVGGGVKLEDIFEQIQKGEQATLNLIIKADVQGTLEALTESLKKLERPEVKIAFVHRAVGAVTENDIQLASTTGSTIIAFNVRPDRKSRTMAEEMDVQVRTYQIIYKVIEDMQAAMVGLLKPEFEEIVTGDAEVREVFSVPKIGAIAGCMVRNGMMNRQGKMRVIRDGVEVYEGSIASLRRFKEDAKEVKEGYECGIAIENFNDIKVGDVLECFRTEEIARTL